MNNNIKVSITNWGNHNGNNIYLFKLENPSGAYVEVSNYGATLVSIVVPDKNGELYHAILGFPTLQGYLDDTCYIGSTIGRYANRIGGAAFSLNGQEYCLEANEGVNTNHGGYAGMNTKTFKYELLDDTVCFSIESPDGEAGFPGNLNSKITYTWTAGNELIIHYLATSDKQTVVNFTNHAYFNLSGEEKIFDHEVSVYADHVLEKDQQNIPTGFIKAAGTLKFNNSSIGSKVQQQEGKTFGVNDCYVLNAENGNGLKLAAMLTDTKKARRLTVFTDYPSVMVYSGDALFSEHSGHLSKPYASFDGICFECQYYPDSPNHRHFPSTVLEPAETYDKTIIYQFGSSEH
jgi:aldose 1-epimerase